MCVFLWLLLIFFPYCLFVSNSQVIGCEDRLRNDLYFVGWGVKLCSMQSRCFLLSLLCICTLCTILIISKQTWPNCSTVIHTSRQWWVMGHCITIMRRTACTHHSVAVRPTFAVKRTRLLLPYDMNTTSSWWDITSVIIARSMHAPCFSVDAAVDHHRHHHHHLVCS